MTGRSLRLPGRWAALAVGLLTAVPVEPPAAPGPADWARAITAAPLVGLGLGLAAAAVLCLVQAACGSPLLAAVAAVGLLALATRGLHLDGLADTADGFGAAGKRGPTAGLEAMRSPGTGAFGVSAVVLVVSGQLAALAACRPGWAAALAVVVAAVTARLALVVTCALPWPPAAAGGLGRLVLGAVPPARAGLLVAVCTVGAIGAATALGPGVRAVAVTGAAVPAGCLVALAVARRTRSRIGGLSGDSLGAVVEAAALAALVVLAAAGR